MYYKGIAIDERVLMMWRNHSDGVLDILIDNTSILFEGVGDAALRLRRRFMRTGYVPRDVPESATNVSLELNDSIRILNFARSESDIIEGTMYIQKATSQFKKAYDEDTKVCKNRLDKLVISTANFYGENHLHYLTHENSNNCVVCGAAVGIL